jgi:SAM-dependent methyltransferase
MATAHRTAAPRARERRTASEDRRELPPRACGIRAAAFCCAGRMTPDLPIEIPSPLPGGAPLRLRHRLPHVWTQRAAADRRPFGLYWSDRDGLGRLFPEPGADELTRFYDTTSYAAYMGERAGGGAGASPAPTARPTPTTRVLRRIAAAFERSEPLTPARVHRLVDGKPARVCDLGCGAGELLLGLRALGHDVLGVDPNPTAIDTGRRTGLRVLPGTAEDLPADCPRAAFDVVVMSHSLEHCRDPLRALRHAHSLVRPGGRLVCDVPNHASAGFACSGPSWFHTDAGRHLWFFTPQSLRAMAAATGWTVDGFEFDGFARQFDWLAKEQEVWDALYGDGAGGGSPPPRPSVGMQVRLLGKALLGGAAVRHDAVRLLASRR